MALPVHRAPPSSILINLYPDLTPNFLLSFLIKQEKLIGRISYVLKMRLQLALRSFQIAFFTVFSIQCLSDIRRTVLCVRTYAYAHTYTLTYESVYIDDGRSFQSSSYTTITITTAAATTWHEAQR